MTEIVVEPDGDDLARTIASRLLEEVTAVQSTGATPSLVLTGGSVAERAHREVAIAAAARGGADDTASGINGGAIDWADVEFWWGDERFVPRTDPERNEGQARAALLDGLGVDRRRVHPMPASDGGLDLDEAAADYANELAAADGEGFSPRFDLLMLGLGPDGHIASLFPGRPALHESGRATVGVVGSPKPPPERISLTYPALNRARKVWFIVSGAQKATAVRRAVTGDEAERTPAAGVHGTEETVWLLDRAAARELPAQLMAQ